MASRSKSHGKHKDHDIGFDDLDHDIDFEPDI